MLTGVAFLPHPPVLVPDVAQGAAAELDGLRAACRTAIRAAGQGAERYVLVGSGPHSREHPTGSRGTFAGYGVEFEVALGVPGDGPPLLPLSLSVGAWLLADAVGADATATGVEVAGQIHAAITLDADEPTALLVLGDGSARRSTAAPGYLDDRAADFDAALAAALASGEAARLRADVGGVGGVAGLATELLAPAPPVWEAVSSLLEPGSWDATVHYDDAPYGVGYFVASWVPRGHA